MAGKIIIKCEICGRNIMKPLFGILYLIIFVFFPHINPSSDECPLWLRIFEITACLPACISMILYIIERKPNFLTWIWKIIPFVLVAYIMIDWYYTFLIKGDDSLQFISVVTVLGLLFLYPLVYCTFRYGYSFDFDEKNLRSNRKN